jgi:hypothetical protein
MNFDAVKKPDNNSTLPGLRLFWATAIPLAIGTIILPVIGGKVVRAVVKTNWTILVVFLVDVGMFAVMTTMMTVRPTTGEAMNEVGIWSSLVWYFCLPAGVAIFSASKRLQEMALRSEKPSRFQAFKSMAILDFFMGFFYLFFWMFDFYNRPPAVGYALICFVFCYRFFRFVQNYRRSLRGKL